MVDKNLEVAEAKLEIILFIKKKMYISDKKLKNFFLTLILPCGKGLQLANGSPVNPSGQEQTGM